MRSSWFGRCRLNDLNLREAIAEDTLAHERQHLWLDIGGEHLSGCSHASSQPHGVIPGPGTDIGDDLTGLDVERLDGLRRRLLAFAFRSLEPRGALVSHDLGDDPS